MTIDKVTLINQALILIGSSADFSIDMDTARGAKCLAAWDAATAEALSLAPLPFFTETSLLTKLAVTPINGWSYGHMIPGDAISDTLKLTRDPQCDSPVRDFKVEGGNVYSNEPVLYGTYQRNPDPASWPWAWRNAHGVLLQAYLAVPIKQDTDLEKDRRAQAVGTPSQGGTGGMFGRLISQAKAGEPVGSPLLRSDPLTDARYQS